MVLCRDETGRRVRSIERRVIVALRGCEGPAIGIRARWLGMGSGLDVVRA
ncbi:hypothetical protein SEA_JERM2_92 [Mycobacterium phage Jerm2]|nr:hypothetical protein SEA_HERMIONEGRANGE_96 [Mycobacterium phage HermioneGrange]QNJ56660.1 hypothetical protein SEA_JERM2_92 [Mycobacterium phage Jerm2]